MDYSLDPFRVCAWPVASATEEEVTHAKTLAEAHARPTVILSTCQRIEVYGFEECGCDAPVRFSGHQALAHMVEVAAGLHAAVLGESQVLGQVRAAVAEAPHPLRHVADMALAAAREVRRRVGTSADTGQVLDLALALAGRPPGGRLLVLGGGQMGSAVAKEGLRLGFDEVVMAVRKTVSPLGAVRHVPLGTIAGLGAFDVVAACLGTRHGPIDLPSLPETGLLVDLGTPRNVSAYTGACVTIAEVLAEAERREADERERLRGIAAEAAARRLTMAMHTRQSPVGRLRHDVEVLRQSEAGRIQRLHPQIPAETVDVITRALVNRLFHTPSERLRNADPVFGARVAALFSEDESEAP